MISEELFLKEISVLESRFGRSLENAVFEGYYQFLNEKLSNDQFSAACRRVFAEEDFFPSPAKFVEKVKANTEDLAVLEWERVCVAAQNQSPLQLSPAGERALKGVGGLSAVGYADIEFGIPRLRKEFLASYKAHSSVAGDFLPALPVAKEVVYEALEPEQISTPLKSVTEVREILEKLKETTFQKNLTQKNEWLKSGDRILQLEAVDWARNCDRVLIDIDENDNPVAIVEAVFDEAF